jgi:hypothetical protein
MTVDAYSIEDNSKLAVSSCRIRSRLPGPVCLHAMHGERFDCVLWSKLIERFPLTTDISDEAVPGKPTTEKGASINVNSLT